MQVKSKHYSTCEDRFYGWYSITGISRKSGINIEKVKKDSKVKKNNKKYYF